MTCPLARRHPSTGSTNRGKSNPRFDPWWMNKTHHLTPGGFNVLLEPGVDWSDPTFSAPCDRPASVRRNVETCSCSGPHPAHVAPCQGPYYCGVWHDVEPSIVTCAVIIDGLQITIDGLIGTKTPLTMHHGRVRTTAAWGTTCASGARSARSTLTCASRPASPSAASTARCSPL